MGEHDKPTFAVACAIATAISEAHLADDVVDVDPPDSDGDVFIHFDRNGLHYIIGIAAT